MSTYLKTKKMLGSNEKKCEQCGKEFSKPKKYSLTQWWKSRFCSRQCTGQYVRIKDGMTKGERHRRKNGATKQGSPEWLERIRATTKSAMLRPDVNEKIRKPRMPMSDEMKAVRSNALVGIMPKNLINGYGSFANVQRGDYECSKGTVYFRSKWEANYALFLDFLVKNGDIKDWEYETERFVFEQIKFGTRSYLPDFKIINHDNTFEYHEVKGYMDARSKTKLKRMEKYFPDVKLILIDKKYYSELYKKFNKILKMY